MTGTTLPGVGISTGTESSTAGYVDVSTQPSGGGMPTAATPWLPLFSAPFMPSTPRSTGATPIGNRSGTRPRCYNCGMEGHIARSCPYPRKNKREEEAQVQQRSEPSPTTMSALVGEDNDATIDQLKKRLEKLETKLETKLKQSDCTGVLNTVAAEPGGGDNGLDPTTTAEICVNGVPTRALVDTGSPATIASLEFVLEILQREEGKSDSSAVERRYREEIPTPVCADQGVQWTSVRHHVTGLPEVESRESDAGGYHASARQCTQHALTGNCSPSWDLH